MKLKVSLVALVFFLSISSQAEEMRNYSCQCANVVLGQVEPGSYEASFSMSVPVSRYSSMTTHISTPCHRNGISSELSLTGGNVRLKVKSNSTAVTYLEFSADFNRDYEILPKRFYIKENNKGLTQPSECGRNFENCIRNINIPQMLEVESVIFCSVKQN